MTASEKIRLTLDLTKPLDERLEKLKHITGSASKADVVREALRLYEYLVSRSAVGASFYVEQDGKNERLVILGLTPLDLPHK
jgi:hypothetical protein